ncbi:MAG: (2Fe-2S)-binding protein [Eubacterium sp.]|nr:(2Fe-2S)-binding protein [Eubacterium sp.]
MDREEVICSCLGVTKGMVEDAVKNGAKTLEAVQEATEAGTVCGACIEDLENLIAELTAK